MSEFKVGEIAIYVRPGSPHYGKEVEILSGLFTASWNDPLYGVTGSGQCYIIGFYDDDRKNFVAEPHEVKKKKPPSRDIDRNVSWDDCIWKPSGVRV